MRILSDSHKTWIAAVFGALLAAALGWFLQRYPIGKPLVYSSYDLLHVFRGDIHAGEAVLVYMDEASHKKLGQSYIAAWDRRLHARLVDRLTAAGAKVIVFDIIFSDPSNPAGDAEFAQAIERSKRVVLAADNVLAGDKTTVIVPPLDIFRDAAVEIASAEMVPDTDQTIRKHTPEEQLPALSWAAAAAANAKLPDSSQITDRWLQYYGRPDHLPFTSFYQALDPAQTKDDFFRGKVVFVGARLVTKFSGQRKDEFRNPYSMFVRATAGARPFTSGVEIQATAFLNLLRGEWLTRPGFRWERFVIVLAGFLIGGALVPVRPTFAAVGAALAIIASVLAAFLLFRNARIWFPWLILIVQIGVALSWSVLFNSIQLYVQKRLYEQTLARYLSPKFVKKFAKDPELLHRPARKQLLTLVFTDIEGFTSLSEGTDSDELSKTMNQYFEMAVSLGIHKCDGTVVKYIGDAIFAFWNAPEEQIDHPLRAAQAALCLRDLPLRWVDGRPIRTRIGVHTGHASVGNFGSREHIDYTALGENVNLASRVEALNKHLATTCLVTGATHDGIAGRLVTREVGAFCLKGFEKAVQIFELIDEPANAAVTAPWREAFHEGIVLFKKRNFVESQDAFQRVLRLRPEDGPSKFYLGLIEKLQAAPPQETWTGEIEMEEK